MHRSTENLLQSDSMDSLNQHSAHHPPILLVAPTTVIDRQQQLNEAAFGTFTTTTTPHLQSASGGNLPPKPMRRNMHVQHQVEVHRATPPIDGHPTDAAEDISNSTAKSGRPVPLPRRMQMTSEVQPPSPSIRSWHENETVHNGPDLKRISTSESSVEDIQPDMAKPLRQLLPHNSCQDHVVVAAEPTEITVVHSTTPTSNDGKSERKPSYEEHNLAYVASSDTETERKASVNDQVSNDSSRTSYTDEPSKPIALPRLKPPKKPVRKHATVMNRAGEHTDDSVDSEASASGLSEAKKPLTYERIIGIHLHDTSPMMFDYAVRAPMVRCSIRDAQTGQLLRKSDPHRSAVQSNEPPAVDYVQPLISKACVFKQSEYIECAWNELLLINEDISHIQSGNEIIFFEVISIVSKDQSDFLNISMTDGWQYLCWAFLRPGDPHTFSHIDRRVRLQLFEYRRPLLQRFTSTTTTPPPGVFKQWQMAHRQKYPATLAVTVKSFRPIATNEGDSATPAAAIPEQMRRPQHALQVDRLSEPSAHMLHAMDLLNPTTVSAVTSPLLDQWRRLPGAQSCQMPNTIVTRLQAQRTHSRGSLCARFSPDGRRLAVALVPSLPHDSHTIAVLRVPDGRTDLTLAAHTGLVYALDWRQCTETSTQLLLSVSADRMAIVWRIGAAGTADLVVVFPHPCFVYVGMFLEGGGRDEVLVASGGRDGVLRIWGCTLADVAVESVQPAAGNLLQELQMPAAQGDRQPPQASADYITAVVGARMASHIYTCTWRGRICEWTRRPDAAAFDVGGRIVSEMGGRVRRMLASASGKQLYVTHNDASVKVLDVRTGQVLRTIAVASGGGATLRGQWPCIAVSACGSVLVCVSGGRMLGWSLLDGRQLETFRLPVTLGGAESYATAVDWCRNTELCCVTVYDGGKGGDAGVLVLGFDKKRREEVAPNQPTPGDETPPLKPNNRAPMPPTQQKHQQDLNRIIQRIDEIFQRPQNKTDDVKTANIHRAIDVGEKGVVDVASSDNSCTYGMEMAESLKRTGTFVIKRPANRTFTVSSRGELVDDGAESGDGTTISESL